MLEVGISRINGKRRALEVDVDPIEPIVAHYLRNRGHVVRNAVRIGKCKVLTATAERDHHLLAPALQVRDVGFELCDVESCGCAKLHGPFRWVPVRRGEGDEDNVPLGGHITKREGRTRSAVTGPVSDEMVTVRSAAGGDRRDRGFRGGGHTSSRTQRSRWARLGRVGETVCVWKAVC